MSSKITIGKINVIQEKDLYATGQYTRTSIWLDPTERKVVVDQVMRTNSTSASLYHGRELEELIAPSQYEAEAPDENALRKYLEGDDAQGLLSQVCDGYEIEWDGRNMVGNLNEDAKSAWTKLLRDIDNLPRSEWRTWEVEEWLDNSTISDLGVRQGMTDDEIEEAAQTIISQAKSDNVSIDGDVAKYLKNRLAEDDSE
jgi:hypothetical protein